MNLQAYILAGGKSSRMGEDKGLKLLKGIPVIQHEIKVLSSCFSNIKINTSNREYTRFGLELIADEIPDKGPMGGIYTALKNSDQSVFIVSCDMPFITSGAIRYLVEQHKIAPATIAACNQKIQPLFGIYTHNILPVLEKNIQSNQLKMKDFIQEIGADIIEMNKVINSQVFLNVNTPEEFKTIEK